MVANGSKQPIPATTSCSMPSLNRLNHFVCPLARIIYGGSSRNRGGARRGNTPPGSSEGSVPPSWGFYKGVSPLVRVGEAGSRAEPACLDAGPTASRCVAPALARSSALSMIVAEERIPQWVLTFVSAIAAERYMNNAG